MQRRSRSPKRTCRWLFNLWLPNPRIPVAYLKSFRESGQELALASDILRNRALDAILTHANPVDEDGNQVDLSIEVPEVEAEVVHDEIVEGEVVMAEVVEEEE